jgi:hypothetical protein
MAVWEGLQQSSNQTELDKKLIRTPAVGKSRLFGPVIFLATIRVFSFQRSNFSQFIVEKAHFFKYYLHAVPVVRQIRGPIRLYEQK